MFHDLEFLNSQSTIEFSPTEFIFGNKMLFLNC